MPVEAASCRFCFPSFLSVPHAPCTMLPSQFALHARIEDTHWWFVGRRRIFTRFIRRLVPPRPGAVLVDVGCGTGANLAGLSAGYACHGIDPSEDAIRFARERFPAIRFVHGSSPFDLCLDAPADLLLFADVLEHVDSDVELLASYLPCLSPTGHVLIAVPADPGLWSPQDVHLGHRLRYTPERLAEAWRGLPLEPLLVSHFNARLHPVVRAIRAYTAWRGRPWGEAGTDLALPSPAVNRLLTSVLAGEGSRLLKALDSGARSSYARGVSLLAVLKHSPR